MLAPLFEFGKERLETLTPGVFIFGQPGLEQTQKTKSVVHTQRRFTLQALVRLMPNRWEQISEGIECHWGRQIVGVRGNHLSCLLRTGRECTAEVAELILNVSRILHRLGHFIAQQPAVALPHVVEQLFHRTLG
jgi:hypothetical protein